MAHARLIALGLWLAGCGSHTPVATHSAPAPAPTARVVPPAIEAHAFRAVRSKHMSLAITLPDADGWDIDDGPQWFRLRHRATESELSLRVWRASRRVRVTECEQQVRLVRPDLPDPTAAPESVIEQRPLDAPEGYAVELTVAVRPAEGDRIAGHAVAIGAAIGHCYAAIFSTQAGGSGAENAVAERLALAADQVFGSVTLGRIDDRAR